MRVSSLDFDRLITRPSYIPFRSRSTVGDMLQTDVARAETAAGSKGVVERLARTVARDTERTDRTTGAKRKRELRNSV